MRVSAAKAALARWSRYAAQHYGVGAHGVTLVEEQLALAREMSGWLAGLRHARIMTSTLMEGEFDKTSPDR